MKKEFEKKFVSLEWEIIAFSILIIMMLAIFTENYVWAITFLVLGFISLFLFLREWKKYQ